MEGELISNVKEACPLAVTQVLQELGAGRLSCRWGVGRRESVVGNGDIAMQGMDVGVVVCGVAAVP